MTPSRALTWAVLLTIIFLGCAKRDKALFDDAQKQWLDGDYQGAVSKLVALEGEYPTSPYSAKALFRLGEIHYLNLDEPQKALDYFARLTKREMTGQQDLKARDYIAEIYGNSLQNYDLAILQYQETINDYRDNIEEDRYRYRIAESYFHKGDYSQAEIEYQTLLVKFPDSKYTLDARYQIANCKFITGAAKEALNLFKNLLEDYPGNKYEYDIRLGRAICHEELFQLEKALTEYVALKKRYPEKMILERKIDSIKQRLDKKLRRNKGSASKAIK